MKFTAVCLAVLLTCTSAYVTNNNKVIETTTKLPVDDDYELVDKSSVDSKTENPKNIYLEDVVAGLVHQNWSSDEILCLNQTLELIRSLQNFTLWAVWEWDSVSSQPMGIMSGNRYQLGNFDQCMRAPWSATHPEIKTQYCLAEVKLEREHHAKKKRLEENEPYGNALDFIQHHTPYVRPLNHLTWGACVPASCQPRSVERLVSTVLARSHLGVAGLRPSIEAKEPCQMADRPREYDALFYAFIALALVMSITCLICTSINIKNKEPRKQSLKYNICKAFCIRDNCRDLLKVNKDGLDTIYGIRYISICFISICHEAGLLDSGPLSNGIKVDRNFITSAAVFVVHDDVFVDTFFFISGFLLAKTIVTFKKVPVLLYLIKRYLRLAVAFAVVIFYMVAIFPHTGSGPLWNRLVKDEAGTCRKNWWLSLLMVNNYIRSDELCLFVTWYIPCDFHFFVLAVVTYAIYRRWRSLGIMCAGALAVASVVTPGVINYVYEQAAIHMFTYDFLSDPRNNQQFQLTYIKSHTRAAPYIIGFAAGAYYAKKKNDIKFTKTRATVSAWLGVVVMLLVMVSGSSYLWRSYSNLESALYAALNRPVWAAGVALLILSCSFGKVPLLQGFLSWYPWVPLSRLAYGQYLTHTLIILRNVGVVRNSVYYDDFNVFVSAMGVIAVGTGTALIVYLLAEAPINNLFTLLVTSKNRSQQNQDDQTKSNTTTQIGDRVNMGYIQDNLTDNLNSSSKM